MRNFVSIRHFVYPSSLAMGHGEFINTSVALWSRMKEKAKLMTFCSTASPFELSVCMLQEHPPCFSNLFIT